MRWSNRCNEKTLFPNARNTVRDGNAGQTDAITKRLIPNARNAVRDGNAGQTGAIIKRHLPNARNAVSDGHAGQTDAILNTSSSMLVTLLGMVTLVKPMQ